jgi:ankyrin repeat protein
MFSLFRREKTINGETMRSAIANGKIGIVRALLESGVRIGHYDKNDITPLFQASSNGNAPIVKALIEAGAKVDELNEYNQYDYDDLLIGENDDGDLVSESESTALYIACVNKHKDVIKLLLKAGANPDIPNEEGTTPLCETVKYYDKYNTNIIKSLIAANADVNKADMDSRTPLYYAREAIKEGRPSGSPAIIKMLIDAGAKDENENELIPPASNKPIKIPEDKQENAISYEDILDGDDVVVITEKNGHEFFFKYKTLNEWFNRLKQRKVDIENPLTKVKVKKGDVTRGIANIKSSKGGTRRFRKNARKITRKR